MVDPERLAWRPGLEGVRAAVRAEVPRLVTPRRIPPIGRLLITLRYLGLVLAVW